MIWTRDALASATVGVFGLGRSGLPSAKRLAALGARVLAADEHATPGMLADLKHTGAEFVQTLDPTGLDLLVPSPGIPPHHRVVSAAVAAGVDVRSEVDLAAGLGTAPIIAITGTNGKTTTTRMIGAILTGTGNEVVVAGNIGSPLIDHFDDPADFWVAEVSSFSLRFAPTFHPRVAVITNVAHDHLDWHGSFDEYVRDKGRIASNLGEPDTLVIPAGDPRLEQFAREGVAVARFGPGSDFVPGPGGEVIHGGSALGVLPRIHERGTGFMLDACAAVAACRAVGVDPERSVEVLSAFEVEDHRMATVATINGVRWINDSKATNPHAAAAAVASFPEAVLIAGGRNKGLSFSELASMGTRLRKVIAIGECAGEVEAAFTDVGVPVVRASDLADAVGIASETAIPGDVVLLAPAAASQDMFVDYADRGRRFCDLVRKLEA